MNRWIDFREPVRNCLKSVNLFRLGSKPFLKEAGAHIRGGVGGGGGVRHPPNIFRVGPKLNEKSVHDKAWIV